MTQKKERHCALCQADGHDRRLCPTMRQELMPTPGELDLTLDIKKAVDARIEALRSQMMQEAVGDVLQKNITSAYRKGLTLADLGKAIAEQSDLVTALQGATLRELWGMLDKARRGPLRSVAPPRLRAQRTKTA